MMHPAVCILLSIQLTTASFAINVAYVLVFLSSTDDDVVMMPGFAVDAKMEEWDKIGVCLEICLVNWLTRENMSGRVVMGWKQSEWIMYIALKAYLW